MKGLRNSKRSFVIASHCIAMMIASQPYSSLGRCEEMLGNRSNPDSGSRRCTNSVSNQRKVMHQISRPCPDIENSVSDYCMPSQCPLSTSEWCPICYGEGIALTMIGFKHTLFLSYDILLGSQQRSASVFGRDVS